MRLCRDNEMLSRRKDAGKVWQMLRVLSRDAWHPSHPTLQLNIDSALLTFRASFVTAYPMTTLITGSHWVTCGITYEAASLPQDRLTLYHLFFSSENILGILTSKKRMLASCHSFTKTVNTYAVLIIHGWHRLDY